MNKYIYIFIYPLLTIIFLFNFSNKVAAKGCFIKPGACSGATTCPGGICTATVIKGVTYYCCTDPENVSIERDFNLGISNIFDKPLENLSAILSSILPNIYVVAGIILLFLIIGGGFAIMTSTNDPQKKGQGGSAITAALIGFLILFASYWLIQIIEKITGVPILTLSPLGI